MGQGKLILFGTPRLEYQGQPLAVPLRKALALLIYLSVTRQPYSRDALATLFWPEKNQSGARTNLRRTLYDLVQLLGPALGEQLLDIGPETIRLQPDAALWVDATAFQTSVAAPGDGLAQLTATADLYTDDFLADFTLPDCPEFADWQSFQREALRSRYAQLLQQIAAGYAAGENFVEAIHYARRWLLLDPLEESVHRTLMRLYAQARQRAAALRQYEECVRILVTELGVTPQVETTALYEAIRTKRFPLEGVAQPAEPRQNAPAEASVATLALNALPLAHNLPAYTTPFIGRAADITEILQRLKDPTCRLLTLIGSGGLGKTRLAVAIGQRIAAQPDPKLTFLDGVFFVGLQAVSAPEALVPAIAEITGLRFYGNDAPQQQLMRFLQEKRMLLILDNFEHLLAGIDLLAALLSSTSHIKLLVTSREALNLQEEWFHPLAGLALPSARLGMLAQHTHDVADPADAVQFFVQNARRARVEFSLLEEEQAVARICRLVDGLPLALELAATWLKVLSCAQIADEIAHSLDILTTRQQNIPARHRSMRAVLEQSWQLLDSREQSVLKQFGLFRGGFGQEAAIQVAGASLLVLASLVEKALIHQTEGRYQMHELLRQFAAEQLAHTPVHVIETQARHSRYYLNFLQICPDISQLDPDLENIRMGWRFAVAQQHFVWLQGATDALYRYASRRAIYQEGRNDFTLLVERLAEVADRAEWQLLLCIAQRCLGAFCYYLGDYTAAERHLQQALACAQAVQASGETTLVLTFLGLVAGWQGREAESDQLFQQSLSLNRVVGDEALKIELFIKIAQLRGQQGRYADAQHFGEESLVASRRLGQAYWIIRALDVLGFTMYRLGQSHQSRQYYSEGLRMAEATNDAEGFLLNSSGLGLAANSGDRAEILAALPYVEKGLQIARQMGHPFYITSRLVILGALHNRLGENEQAFTYSLEGAEVARNMSNPYFTVINLHHVGAAARHLKRFKISHACLRESIVLAIQANMGSAIADGLYEMGLLLYESIRLDEMTESAVQAQKTAALIWLLCTIQHPACDTSTKANTRLWIAQLEAELPTEQVAAAHAQSQNDLTVLVAPLIAEVEPVP